MDSTDANASTSLVCLTETEADRLSDLEVVVERARERASAAFIEAGNALTEIRDARLYRQTHGTFEDYLAARWNMSRANGYRLIEAAVVVEAIAAVSPRGDMPTITTERQARAIAPVVREQGPEAAAELLAEAVASSGGKRTTSAITRAVKRSPAMNSRKRDPEPNPAPAQKAKRRRGSEPTDDELAVAVSRLGDAVVGMVDGSLAPRAVARVLVNNLNGEPRVLAAFVAEINAYAEQATR